MKSMSVSYSKVSNCLCGELIYRVSEYSFDFICSSIEQLNTKVGSQGCTSLSVSTLQIEVGVETGVLLYPWGFFPLMNVGSRAVDIPDSTPGEVFIEFSGMSLVQGVSFDIPGSQSWVVFKDTDSDWIYIGPDGPGAHEGVYIEFASNSLVGIFEGQLSCFFIKPQFHS